MRRRLRTLALSVTAGILLTGGLTSCGSLDLLQQEDDKTDVQVLTIEQVQSALLTARDVGPGLRKVAGSDDSSGGMGCLDKATAIYIPVLAERSVLFRSATASGIALVEHEVSSFPDDPDAVSDHVDRFRKALRGCRKIRATDKNGDTLRLRVTTNGKKPIGAVDEQLNVNVTGTMSNGPSSIPFAMWLRMSRIGNHTSTLSVGQSGKLRPAVVDTYAKKAARRLDRVVRTAQQGEKN